MLFEGDDECEEYSSSEEEVELEGINHNNSTMAPLAFIPAALAALLQQNPHGFDAQTGKHSLPRVKTPATSLRSAATRKKFNLLSDDKVQLPKFGESTKKDLFNKACFKRQDEADDLQFYAQPRFVKHVDDAATVALTHAYE